MEKYELSQDFWPQWISLAIQKGGRGSVNGISILSAFVESQCQDRWLPLPKTLLWDVVTSVASLLSPPPPPTLGDVLNQFKLCPLMPSDKLKSLDPLTPSTLLNTRIHIIYFFFCDNKHEYPYNYALEMLQPFDPVCSQHLSQLSIHEYWENVRPFDWDVTSFIGRYLVPVLRPPRSSRSIHFGDVSETNDQIKTRPDHVTRDTQAARNNKA